MAKYTRFINDDHWKLLAPPLPKPPSRPKGGRPPADNRDVLEGFFGSFAPVPDGRIYRIDIQVLQPA